MEKTFTLIEHPKKKSKYNQLYTETTNGAVAFSQYNFLKNVEDALVALNISITTKNDFQTGLPFLQKIMYSNSKVFKVYAVIFLMYVRDIEFGKGLRKPFLEGMTYLYQIGYQELVCQLVEEIPEFGYYKDLCNLYDISQQECFIDLEKSVIEAYKNGLKYEFEQRDYYEMKNCAKFAPRQQKKYKNFAYQLSISLFPDSKTPQKDYRKYIQQIMSKYSQVTEVLMSSNNWDKIDPKYVPSLCFQRYKKCFLKTEQDQQKRQILKERYEKYINDAIEGINETKINAKRLNVDTVTAEFLSCTDELQLKALEAQFLDIVNDLKKKGSLLKKCVCMCDVSNSMQGVPMNACIGLGVAINELNEGLYQNSIMTFSQYPAWVKLRDSMTFQEKIKTVRYSQWNLTTNFYEAMKLVADSAKRKEEIPKAIFVLSDMQFNTAQAFKEDDNKWYYIKWETTMQKIQDYYNQQGYNENDIPTIIFWNLRSESDNFTVDTHQKKVLCLSGYSQSLLKAIIQAPDLDYIYNLSPFSFLQLILDNNRYSNIKNIANKCINN